MSSKTPPAIGDVIRRIKTERKLYQELQDTGQVVVDGYVYKARSVQPEPPEPPPWWVGVLRLLFPFG